MIGADRVHEPWMRWTTFLFELNFYLLNYAADGVVIVTLQDGAEIDRLRRQIADLESRVRDSGAGSDVAASRVAAGAATEAWRRWRSVEDFPRDRPLFVSFSNAHYSDLMLNWVEMLRVLDVRTHAQPPPPRALYLIPRTHARTVLPPRAL